MSSSTVENLGHGPTFVYDRWIANSRPVVYNVGRRQLDSANGSKMTFRHTGSVEDTHTSSQNFCDILCVCAALHKLACRFPNFIYLFIYFFVKNFDLEIPHCCPNLFLFYLYFARTHIYYIVIVVNCCCSFVVVWKIFLTR